MSDSAPLTLADIRRGWDALVTRWNLCDPPPAQFLCNEDTVWQLRCMGYVIPSAPDDACPTCHGRGCGDCCDEDAGADR